MNFLTNKPVWLSNKRLVFLVNLMLGLAAAKLVFAGLFESDNISPNYALFASAILFLAIGFISYIVSVYNEIANRLGRNMASMLTISEFCERLINLRIDFPTPINNGEIDKIAACISGAILATAHLPAKDIDILFHEKATKLAKIKEELEDLKTKAMVEKTWEAVQKTQECEERKKILCEQIDKSYSR